MSELLGKYGVEASDVAVLTPYVAQKARIKSILEERVKDWKTAQNKKKMKNLGNLQNIRVQTITESQGISVFWFQEFLEYCTTETQLKLLMECSYEF